MTLVTHGRNSALFSFRCYSDCEPSPQGPKHAILLIEDIVDTGHTITHLKRMLQAQSPKSIALCGLLDKAERREVEVPIEYCGFVIPNVYVVGYGLDYKDRYRNLPYIAVLPLEERQGS